MFLTVMYRTGLLDGMTDTEVAIYTGSTLHEVAHVAGGLAAPWTRPIRWALPARQPSRR